DEDAPSGHARMVAAGWPVRKDKHRTISATGLGPWALGKQVLRDGPEPLDVMDVAVELRDDDQWVLLELLREELQVLPVACRQCLVVREVRLDVRRQLGAENGLELDVLPLHVVEAVHDGAAERH